jgi:hypothetical protein
MVYLIKKLECLCFPAAKHGETDIDRKNYKNDLSVKTHKETNGICVVYSWLRIWTLDAGIVGELSLSHLTTSYNNILLLLGTYYFFFLCIFRVFFCVYVPLPPLRGQHTVLCHPRWLPTSGLTEFALCWGGAGFEPRTTDLQSGALPLSHLSS